jgi:hypothetical protein
MKLDEQTLATTKGRLRIAFVGHFYMTQDGLAWLAPATKLGWAAVTSRRSGLQDFLPATMLFDFGDAWSLALALQSQHGPAARQEAAVHSQKQMARAQGTLRRQPAVHGKTQRIRQGSAA